jgi:hypothetical protein
MLDPNQNLGHTLMLKTMVEFGEANIDGMGTSIGLDRNGRSSRADWRQVEQLYAQLSRIKKDSNYSDPPPELTARLAESITRVFASYEAKEEQFLVDLRELMADVDGFSDDPRDRFRWLYIDDELQRFQVYNPSSTGTRRRPRPFEAAVETVRRILDLNRVRDRLAPLSTSAVLGGSLSYGRFFNTTGGGGGRPSDIDLIVVVPGYTQLHEVAPALGELPFIEQRSIEAMGARVEAFRLVNQDTDGPTVFQHKLRLWEEDSPSDFLDAYQTSRNYLLAIHVVSLEDFAHITLSDLPSLEMGDEGFVRTIYEYRDDRPSRASEEHACFAGHRKTTPMITEEVRGGYLTELQVCEITDGRFYPGMHMNLLLPQFDLRWESPLVPIRLKMQALHWKLLARLSDERRLRHLEVQQLSMSHTRSQHFAPHVAERLDRG